MRGEKISPELLTKRQMVVVSEKEKRINRADADVVASQQRQLIARGGSPIYDEQKHAAKKIVDQFNDDASIVMLLALGMTQSGKTGVITSTIGKALECDSPVPVENIFIITGLSDVQWVEQTKCRVPKELHGNIFHRNQLRTDFSEKVRGKKNVLILIDEVQIACKKDQTLAATLKECGLLEMQYLLTNDIKIVEFSATPNGTIYDSEKWGNHSGKIIVKPGEGYTSCFNLLKDERVKQCESLVPKAHFVEVEHSYNEIKRAIEIFSSPKWHIIRIPTGENAVRCGRHFSKFFKFKDGTYDMKEFNQQKGPMLYCQKKKKDVLTNDINDWLKDAPEKHTFIFIKEKARCAKTFIKKHIGIWYERCAETMMDDVVTQGLLGRATGYDDNGESVIFTNIDSVKKYEKLWNSGFTEDVGWISGTTKSKKDKATSSTGTFNRPTNGGVVVIPEDKPKQPWEGLPMTHDIVSGFEEYEGDGSLEDLGAWFKKWSPSQPSPFRKSSAKDGWAHPSEQRIGGGEKVLRKNLEAKVGRWEKKGDSWMIESFGIKKEDINKITALPGPDDDAKKRAYVCYNSFEEGQEKKPVLYWRKLAHK